MWVVAKVAMPMALRWIYRYEMQHLLELCGYQVDALYRDVGRDAFRYGGEPWCPYPSRAMQRVMH